MLYDSVNIRRQKGHLANSEDKLSFQNLVLLQQNPHHHMAIYTTIWGGGLVKEELHGKVVEVRRVNDSDVSCHSS